MLTTAQWPQVVQPSLARRATTCRRQVWDGVIKIHPVVAGGVGKATGRHAYEHGFADSPRNLIAVDWRGVLRVDGRLHRHIASRLAQEPANLAQGHRSDSFEATYTDPNSRQIRC